MPVEHDAIPAGPQQSVVWATIVEGPPDALERTLHLAQGQLLAAYRGQAGWQGAVGLLSFDRRRSMLLNFWENAAALHEGSAELARLRQRATAFGLTITSSDRFEILFDERVQ